MPDKLKPCPFCGSEAKLDSYSDGIFVVTCSRYCISLPQGGAAKEDAIRKWNHRAEIKE